MVALSDAIFVLFPNADPLIDYLIQDDGKGQYIKSWNLTDPQPTVEALNAVTQEQVDTARKIAYRNEAIYAAFGSPVAADTANRTDAVITHTALNDIREMVGALLVLIGKTPADLQVAIDQNRTSFLAKGGTFEQTPTPSAQIAGTLTRIPESTILKMIEAAIKAGYGDPIK